MAFTEHNFFTLLCEMFPDDRPANFNDIASLIIQRVKVVLDGEQMPAADQRRYVKDVLNLETVLMQRAVFDAELPGTTPPTEAEAREIVQHWLAVFWPVESA